MSKDKSKSLGEHVRFTKYDHRPYVEPIDLVKSENFQRIVKNAADRRRQALAEEKGRGEQH